MILRRKIIIPVLVLIALWLSYLVLATRSQRDLARQHVHDLESKIADTQTENQFLASSSAYFSSDTYLEHQARVKLNYKLPDEESVYVYQDKGIETESSDTGNQQDSSQIPIWKKLWQWLRGK